ncbi:sugar-binding domain-containing protein [Lapillicoccus sp.]|uniref:sugar-binding transcriptional regulator n=1 Tax=Lapillicoccus sp. TaxID=1909287 RepID=UPI003267D5D2
MDVPELVSGPAQLVLTATVARRYYVDGRSKVEIADELQISRFKVARLLEQALSTGLVRIEIGHPGSIDVELSSRLRDHLGLRTAIVVETQETDQSALRSLLARAAGELLTETVTAADVLGFAWARAVASLVPTLGGMAAAPVVQLTGSLVRDDLTVTSTEIVRDVGRLTGGRVSCFYAPFLLPDRETARTLRKQADIAKVLARFSDVTKAVVGLGAWGAGRSTIFDAMTVKDRRALNAAGVVADVSGVFLDAEGRIVGRDQTARLICMDAAQLAGVDEVFAVPYGVEKSPAVLAAARSGLVTSMVTHDAMARELLGMPAV